MCEQCEEWLDNITLRTIPAIPYFIEWHSGKILLSDAKIIIYINLLIAVNDNNRINQPIYVYIYIINQDLME